MSSQIDKRAQQEMQAALAAYKEKKAKVKEFYPCSQKLTLWLEQQGPRCK